jgi:hypothetical protein
MEKSLHGCVKLALAANKLVVPRPKISLGPEQDSQRRVLSVGALRQSPANYACFGPL